MKIRELFNKRPVISLEIFPPKAESSIHTVVDTIADLSDLAPDFMSVTYGAGGSSKDYTVQIADIVKNKYGIEALAHLTCINSSKAEIEDLLSSLKERNIENVLALRGDIPEGERNGISDNAEYKHAKDLITHIKSFGGFCIGAACYPEGHIESSNKLSDLRNLKNKIDYSTDFLITQLFLDNNLFYSFKEKLDIMGVSIPVSAGIMPVINKKQIVRITNLCGARIPIKFKKILDRYENNPEALKEAGIAYATEQIIDLLSSGVDGIHLYTMNRPEVARKIISHISSIRSFLDENKECGAICS